MPQAYSNDDREADPYALPDIEIFELTAREIAETDEDLIWDYMKRREFRLAGFNSRDRDAMFDAMIKEHGIKGGWFWWSSFPVRFVGPFETYQEALDDARDY